MIYTQATWPSVTWPNFTFTEVKCSHTGLCDVDEEFMDLLQQVRLTYGKPMRVNSFYRHPTHPVEAAKTAPGAHTTGKAVDIGVGRGQAYVLLRLGIRHFDGVGIKQHGEGRFLHFDNVTPDDIPHIIRPTVWSYK